MRRCTSPSTSSSVALSGRLTLRLSLSMPASAHAFFLARTYDCESLRSPTSTTARPGTLPPVAFFSASTPTRTCESERACERERV